MTKYNYVAIDIAKVKNDVLIEDSNGKRRKMKIYNKLSDFNEFNDYLNKLGGSCIIGVEPTGNYHRPICYFLKDKNFDVKFVSSLAVARTREALHNSWDKNDPKDAQVILHMLKSGVTQTYYDPIINDFNDIQELSKTHYLVSRRKTKLQHNLLTHYLPLYFPEAQKFMHASRAEWLYKFLLKYPTPKFITCMTEKEFIKDAWEVAGKKVAKASVLAEFYLAAQSSIGVPVKNDSQTVEMLKLLLEEALNLTLKRKGLEAQAHNFLKDNQQYRILRTIPGIGPILALTIIAETGDLRRFSHHRKFINFCGFNLSTHQSGQFRGRSKLSKRGNARLRCAFWMAATVAVRQRENSFRYKYERYISSNPLDKDLKRKALTATAAKLARVAYSLVKDNKNYRPYYEASVPGGGIRSDRP